MTCMNVDKLKQALAARDVHVDRFTRRPRQRPSGHDFFFFFSHIRSPSRVQVTDLPFYVLQIRTLLDLHYPTLLLSPLLVCRRLFAVCLFIFRPRIPRCLPPGAPFCPLPAQYSIVSQWKSHATSGYATSPLILEKNSTILLE